MNTTSIWIVDDDEDDQIFIRRAFESGQSSMRVLSLNDGAALLSELEHCAELPSLILLDINMSRKNGFEALQEMKAVPAYAGVPVIMLTTSSLERDRDLALALGADQFFTKPVSFDKFKSLAQEVSEHWHLV